MNKLYNMHKKFLKKLLIYEKYFKDLICAPFWFAFTWLASYKISLYFGFREPAVITEDLLTIYLGCCIGIFLGAAIKTKYHQNKEIE